jgi:ABC-2 type transport system permease protein
VGVVGPVLRVCCHSPAVELILGRTLRFALIGLVEVLFVRGAALLAFHIPLRGSLLLLLFS